MSRQRRSLYQEDRSPLSFDDLHKLTINGSDTEGNSFEWERPSSRSVSTRRNKRELYVSDDENLQEAFPSEPKSLHTPKTNPGTSSDSSKRRKGRELYMPHSKSCPDISHIRKALYKQYTKCRCCGKDTIIEVPDRDGYVLMLQCASCSASFGVDDSMSSEDLLELYEKGCLQTQTSCCDNTDPDKFIIVDFDGINITVKCEKCSKLTVLNDKQETQLEGTDDEANFEFVAASCSSKEDAQGKDVSSTRDSDEIACGCGNSDPEQVMLYWNHGGIQSVSCVRCNDSLDMETEEEEGMDLSEYVACKCDRKDRMIKVVKDSDEEIEIISCQSCNYFYLPKDSSSFHTKKTKGTSEKFPRSCSSSVKGAGSGSSNKPGMSNGKPRYRDVKSLSELSRGDHVMWDRWEGYYHHAIVEEVLLDQGKIKVVHYNGPSPTGQLKIKGKIIAEILDPFAPGKGRMYCAVYTDCFPADEVIRRAYERIGEIQYSLIGNNCEHFATYCKTGERKSFQVTSVLACMQKYGKAGLDLMLKKEFSSMGAKAAMQVGGKALGNIGRPLAVTAMAVQEIKCCVTDLMEKGEDRRQGLLSRDAYFELVVNRVGRSMGGITGMALGMMIPIPVVGEFIGGTLGGMIGEFLGRLTGKAVLEMDEKCGNNIKKLMS